MALLTPQQLDAVRQPFCRALEFVAGISWARPKLNAALQAIEDTFTSGAVSNAISNAIDTAIAPDTMTVAQKRELVKWWLRSRFDRGN